MSNVKTVIKCGDMHLFYKKLLRKIKKSEMCTKMFNVLFKKARFILISIMCLLILNFLLARMINHGKITKSSQKTSVVLPYVVVHIDLKGNPPKLEYLESLLPLLKEYGVNGLLMEYEDMFPFDPKLTLAAEHSYSSTDLKNFLIKAAHLGFVIIPLVQTFGHMEYVLKLKEYKHLREDPLYFDSICPSHPQSLVLIEKMLEQVIFFHKNISTLKFMHIGCDEVYHINKCKLCRKKRMADLGIFVNHLQSVIGIVKKLSPDTKILIWDDMFRGIKSNLPKTMLNDTEPVYWDYKPQATISHVDLIKYRRKFRNIWIASAFKGADGRRRILPKLNDRFLNHHSWMSSIFNYKFGGERSIYAFRGIILTGWSRYTHMDAPCEILPASIHSLILSLLVINHYKTELNSDKFLLSPDAFYKQYIEDEFNNILKCDKNGIHNDIWCANKSEKLVELLKTFKIINEEIDKRLADADNGFPMVEFNIKYFYINRLICYDNLEWCKDQSKKLADIEYKLHNVLSPFYENVVLKEYLNYLIYPNKERLNNTITIFNKYLYNTDSWRTRAD